MKRDLYFCEVGVLLPKDDEDYEFYQLNNFHREFGFYDENKLTFLTEEERNNYALDYVKNGVENTYALLYQYNCNIEERELQDIKDFKYSEYSLEMASDDITEFIYKQNNKIKRERL